MELFDSVSVIRAPIRIGIVAGEVSSDLLGAGLMQELKQRLPGASFEGIGGPAMQALGCRSLHPMEKLSVIGFEGLSKYPELRRIQHRLAAHFLSDPPQMFIGIDVPDFNLGLEERLKAAGIRTVHYVSPTVWAWRGYRIRKIHRAVDHMLTLFPFEAKYYRAHRVPVTFVGHPMADQIDEAYDRNAIRRRLNLPEKETVIALLPGSRMNELKRHADLFVETALWLHRRNRKLRFIAPFVDEQTQAVFVASLERHGAQGLPLTRVLGKSRDALGACDIALLASGTATLEAALLRKLMVVTYKVSPLSYVLIRMFAHVNQYSLPNNLAGRKLVPELMQSDAQPEKLGHAVENYLTHPKQAKSVLNALGRIHRTLRRNANVRAAEAVIKFLKKIDAIQPASAG